VQWILPGHFAVASDEGAKWVSPIMRAPRNWRGNMANVMAGGREGGAAAHVRASTGWELRGVGTARELTMPRAADFGNASGRGSST
jgi:hypothetical protein